MRVETTRVGRRRAAELTWGSALISGALVVLIVSLVSAGIVAVSARGNPVSSNFIHAQPGAIRWNGHDRLNILLLGVDAPGPTFARTDGIMLFSVDPRGRSVQILSFPRNLWVTIPGFGQGPMADAYADGGPRLALIVAQSATHRVIPYYLALGTEATRQLVDAYGGINLSDTTFVTNRNRTGVRHLDGNATLRYLMAAHASSHGDTVSMLRQQKVMTTLMRQSLLPQSLFQVPAVINAVGGAVRTNLPYDQLPALARILSSVPSRSVHSSSLDFASGGVTDYAADGTNAQLPDWQRIYSITQRLFPDTSVPPGAVDVENGSGTLGEAKSLALWLRHVGVRVKRYGSADSFNYGRTQVVMNTASTTVSRALAQRVAALLQVPIVTRAVHTSRSSTIIIIGRNYQDPGQQ